jgi:hypothetical protein
MLMTLLLAAAFALAQDPATAGSPAAQSRLDESPDWSVATSDGVSAEVSRVPGVEGEALRFAFEFRQGSGFCVLRRPVAIDMPANYRVTYRLRGEAKANNLELKLIDPTGENVWWVNRRGFEFPRAWTLMVSRARHFTFAWGPSGGKPLTKVGFIEFAVAAGSGGKGWIEIDDLRFEPMPAAKPADGPMAARVSSSAEGVAAPREVAADGRFAWRSAADDAAPTLTLDLGGSREFGGLALEWDAAAAAADYEVETSRDGVAWEAAASMIAGIGGRDYVRLPDGEAAHLRLVVRKAAGGGGVALRSVRLLPPEFAESKNVMMKTIARDAPRGWYPAYYLGEQTPWTIVGVPGAAEEALIDVHGAIELARRGFRVEPFLRVDGKLVTWADAESEVQFWEKRPIPIPMVTWRAAGIRLQATAFADGSARESHLAAWYALHNETDQPRQVELLLAIRPFQVLPPWQDLNFAGGAASVASIARESRLALVNDGHRIHFHAEPTAFAAAAFAGGEIVEHLAAGRLPAAARVEDPLALASAVAVYSFELTPGATKSVLWESPMSDHDLARDPAHEGLAADRLAGKRIAKLAEVWAATLGRAKLTLPPAARPVADAFATAQAHILINRDGPAIQPGSRTYERSWMRDGSLTSTALLATGHVDEVREFIDWYASYQYESGKIPCVVDHRGPDPVPEHDSHGQFIYALATYHRFTKDRSFIESHLPRVIKTVAYIESLRAQRLTDEYKDGPPEKRACYGLVPESISHEGYSAKPMHSYWDDFFILRGLRDAVYIAGVVERPELAARFAKLRAEFEKSLYESINLAMRTKAIDYIPGCVELGDFDATSTAIALFPCGEQARLPAAAKARTFEKYYEFFRDRRDGRLAWEAYTPYEVRLIGTFVRLGQRARSLELIDFFIKDQSPPGWNQWAEVAWRDESAPKFIGDMPHTWVASDFVNAVRSMFVYEDEDAGSLILAAGVPWEWLTTPEGVRIENFPTHYGPVSYHIRAVDTVATIEFIGPATAPPGGVVLALPRFTEKVSFTGGDGDARIDNGRIRIPSTKGRVEVVHDP